jgi:hypothetical protein
MLPTMPSTAPLAFLMNKNSDAPGEKVGHNDVATLPLTSTGVTITGVTAGTRH